MDEKRPEPTLREILVTIRDIVHGKAPDKPASPQKKPLFGFSPGLLLMTVAALVITVAAAVKNMK